MSSFPDPYLETYLSEGYLSLDPIISLAFSSGQPVTDEEAWRDKKPGARYRELRDLISTTASMSELWCRSRAPDGPTGRSS